MNSILLVDIITKQAPFLLIATTGYIITIIIIKILRKDLSELYKFLIKGLAEMLIAATIPMLIEIYNIIILALSSTSSLTTITHIPLFQSNIAILSLPALFSLSILTLLGIVLLFMESERFLSLPLKEMGELNIITKVISIISFILTIILIYSILFLVIFPTNITLINTIVNISQAYLFVIVFDIFFNVLANTVVIN